MKVQRVTIFFVSAVFEEQSIQWLACRPVVKLQSVSFCMCCSHAESMQALIPPSHYCLWTVVPYIFILASSCSFAFIHLVLLCFMQVTHNTYVTVQVIKTLLIQIPWAWCLWALEENPFCMLIYDIYVSSKLSVGWVKWSTTHWLLNVRPCAMMQKSASLHHCSIWHFDYQINEYPEIPSPPISSAPPPTPIRPAQEHWKYCDVGKEQAQSGLHG